MQAIPYRALRVHEGEDGHFSRRIETCNTRDLPAGEVLLRVRYSSLNYKDALSASGNKGITRQYPHTPGIDAAGEVVESSDPRWQAGQPVIVTSYDLGMNTPGGFGEYVRVPGDWVLALPEGMSLYESMALGTAGFTAGLALHKLERMGQRPEMGPVVVTGASGGLGCLAVALLAGQGYEVIALSGKPGAEPFLRKLGAAQVQGREYARDESGRPLLRPRWAGAIDAAGGQTLSTLVRACAREGSIAVCGLVDSPQLSLSVYPFLLNGVNLLGVESATCAMPLRQEIWQRLAGPWRLPDPAAYARSIGFGELEASLDALLAGKGWGRIVLDLGE